MSIACWDNSREFINMHCNHMTVELSSQSKCVIVELSSQNECFNCNKNNSTVNKTIGDNSIHYRCVVHSACCSKSYGSKKCIDWNSIVGKFNLAALPKSQKFKSKSQNPTSVIKHLPHQPHQYTKHSHLTYANIVKWGSKRKLNQIYSPDEKYLILHDSNRKNSTDTEIYKHPSPLKHGYDTHSCCQCLNKSSGMHNTNYTLSNIRGKFIESCGNSSPEIWDNDQPNLITHTSTQSIHTFCVCDKRDVGIHSIVCSIALHIDETAWNYRNSSPEKWDNGQFDKSIYDIRGECLNKSYGMVSPKYTLSNIQRKFIANYDNSSPEKWDNDQSDGNTQM